jgi:tyrosine-specific transport protein
MLQKTNHLVGGVLLIVGTSIGAGMLALPVTSATVGYFDANIFLLISWLIMTVGALLVLEVNLYLPSGSNMISMAMETLGTKGKYLTWFLYLIFLYTLVSAYISGGSDVLQEVLSHINIRLPNFVASILFTLGLGTVVYNGIKIVDYFNRGLMFAKLGILILLMIIISPYVSATQLWLDKFQYLSGSLMVMVTSFGFASIVPSLRQYFDNDVKLLRKAIYIGSLIPLVCYIIWNTVLMGVLPQETLNQIAHDGHTTSGLIQQLNSKTHSYLITDFFRGFSAICMLTAFLGVSIGLFDFIADGLKMQKKGKSGAIIFACTFTPPLALVLFYPDAYLGALQFAGLLCILLLLFIPTLMAYRGRYYKAFKSAYTLQGGKLALVTIGIIASALMLFAIMEMLKLI